MRPRTFVTAQKIVAGSTTNLKRVVRESRVVGTVSKQSQALNLSIPESRRRAPRVPVNVWVTVEHEGTYFDAFAANVGVGGAFVETQTILPYGARLVLHLPLPDVAEVLRLPGIVRWSSQTGFGIQFLELGAKETHAISALVQSAS